MVQPSTAIESNGLEPKDPLFLDGDSDVGTPNRSQENSNVTLSVAPGVQVPGIPDFYSTLTQRFIARILSAS